MKRKWLVVLAAAVMMLGLAVGVSAEVVSGNCGKEGDNLTWEYDTETCVLTISGEGEMEDYSGEWGYYGTKIKKVILNEGIESIGYMAFDNFHQLSEIVFPASLNTIRDRAFIHCHSLKELTLPENITEIEPGAFIDCSGLERFIVLDSDGTGYTAVDGVLYNYDKENATYSLVAYPNAKSDSYTVIDNTEIIEPYAFELSSIREITFPESLHTISDRVFHYCSKLENVNFNRNLLYIGEGAFYLCESLSEITLLSNLNYIDNIAFSDCTSLRSATFIGNAPRSIGSNIFGACASDFTIFYSANASGWTSTKWNGYPTAIFTSDEEYTVTLPDIFTGSASISFGSNYYFTQMADSMFYTYSAVSATMAGAIVPVTHNGDGTYTIANVTGDLVISGTRTPKTELSLLLSDASGCTIHDGCLLGLPAGKTAGDVLALFANLSSGLSVHTADGTTLSASTHIGSGYTVRLTVDGTLYDTLTIVIRGDVNGDRFADELDLLFLQQYYAGHPLKPVHPLAGDINGDGMLTRADVMLLSRTIAGWYAVSAASDSAAAFRLFRPSDLPA